MELLVLDSTGHIGQLMIRSHSHDVSRTCVGACDVHSGNMATSASTVYVENMPRVCEQACGMHTLAATAL